MILRNTNSKLLYFGLLRLDEPDRKLITEYFPLNKAYVSNFLFTIACSSSLV